MKLQNKIKELTHKDKKHILKRYAFFSLIFITSFLLYSNYFHNKDIDFYTNINLTKDIANSNFIEYSVNDYLLELKNDLNVIKYSNEFTNYLAVQDEINLTEVENLFLRFSMNKPHLSQIRMLDTLGFEIARVNHRGDELELVSEENLQDKANRYYYTETKALSNDDVYISNLDLNIEDGLIEYPYRPVIRLSTPLYNEETFLGILIINIDANYIFQRFLVSEDTTYNNSLSIFDPEGYFLYHEDERRLYGHSIEDRQNSTLEKFYPKVYTQMQTDSKTHLINDSRLITHMTIFPYEGVNANQEDLNWTIVHEIDNKNFPVFANSVIFHFSLLEILLLFIILFIIFVIISLIYIQKNDNYRLNLVEKIADETSDAVVISNSLKEIEFVNKSFATTTGHVSNNIINNHTRILKSNIHSNTFYIKLWKEINLKGAWTGNLWEKRVDGSFYPKQMTILAMKNNHKSDDFNYISLSKNLALNDHFLLSTYKNITSSIDKEDRLNTDILNYMFSLDDFDENQYFATIAIQISNYYNHVLPHKYDFKDLDLKIIETFSEALYKHKSFVVKMSPNTFLLGIMNFKNEEEIKSYIHRLINEKMISLQNLDSQILMELLAGVTLCPRLNTKVYEMIDQSFLTLDYLMNYSRENIVYYSSHIKNKITREEQIYSNLKTAISNHEFYLVYQPQINDEQHEIIGYEVLLRWQNEQLGLVSPYEFIKIAEEHGLIIDIGKWVIKESFKSMEKINMHHKKLSINISPLQFLDYDLIPQIMKYAHQYQINLSCVELEITEAVLVHDFSLVQEKLDALRQLGISIAIDDFGTGYSSLQYIVKLDVDRLKIDRAFVKDYKLHDELPIPKNIINIARDLSLSVICEGTEDLDQIKYIKSLGCHIFQGYYFSKPIKLEDIDEFETSFAKKKV
jgi:EAL domain-containing protein (putative c-di-GMP-specific phosphodiesterase class I)